MRNATRGGGRGEGIPVVSPGLGGHEEKSISGDVSNEDGGIVYVILGGNPRNDLSWITPEDEAHGVPWL